jgi:hypothetical protein
MILPKNLAIILSLVLVVTWLSIVVTKYVYYSGIQDSVIIGVGIVVAIAIVLAFILKFNITVYPDRIEMMYIVRTTSIPKEQIIDTRVGELNIIKNYSNWTLKGVSYHTYTAIGEEMGIGLKVTGKRVYFLSSKDPQAIADLLPKEE